MSKSFFIFLMFLVAKVELRFLLPEKSLPCPKFSFFRGFFSEFKTHSSKQRLEHEISHLFSKSAFLDLSVYPSALKLTKSNDNDKENWPGPQTSTNHLCGTMRQINIGDERL